MKIAVIGAGAIGSLVAGYLKLKGKDVSLVGSAQACEAINRNGLEIKGVRGDTKVGLRIEKILSYKPGLAILATKTQDLERAISCNLKWLTGAKILTTQNGVQADSIAANFFPAECIISSIVMFGSTYLEPGKISHNFEGSWIIGKLSGSNDEEVAEVAKGLDGIFQVIVSDEIKGMKYLKVFVNANNCIAGILGMPMQEAFSDLETCSISMAIWKEGRRVMQAAGIKLASLPDFPLERLTKLTSLPLSDAAGVFQGIMRGLSREPLYGSILQSIKRKRVSEIDYLNGEFVRLAKEHKLRAPLNEKLVEMVHRVEKSGKFFTREELVQNTKGLYS